MIVKKINLVGFFVLSVTVLLAQTTQPRVYKISANEAVEIAFLKVADIKNSKLDSALQFQKNKEITGMALPQISGNIGTQNFLNIPVTVLPDFISPAVYGTLVKEGVKDANGNVIKMPASFGSFPAQFGVPYTASAGFTVNQLLFQPDVFIGLKARATSMKYVSSNIDVTKETVKANVYKSYYAVLIAQKRIGFLKDGIKRVEKLYKDQEVMYKNGFIERLDLDKTQVTLNNLLAIEKQVENGISLGYTALKMVMGLQQKEQLVLTDTLSIDNLKKDVLSTENFDYNNRAEVRMLQTVKQLQELDVKRNKLQYIPTIAAYYNFNKNAQRQSFNFFDKGDWFTTQVLGVSINVPIFNGGQREAKTNQAKINLQKTNSTIDNVKNGIDAQQIMATTQLANALSSLDIQQRNFELAQKVYSTTKKKYEQGLGSSFELLQVEQSVEDAQNNYFISLYDAIIAKVDLLKAIGKL
jgi:outer membrane protein